MSGLTIQLTRGSVSRSPLFSDEQVLEAADQEEAGDEEEEQEAEARPKAVEGSDDVMAKAVGQKAVVDISDGAATTNVLKNSTNDVARRILDQALGGTLFRHSHKRTHFVLYVDAF